MSSEKPNFLAVHFDGDFLEHAAFVKSEEEWALLTNLVTPGDHWSPVLIPIETAAAAPDLLGACKEAKKAIYETINKRPTSLSIVHHILEDAIAKAENIEL